MTEPLVEISNISFRVILPKDRQASSPLKHFKSNLNGKIALCATVMTIAILILFIFILIKIRRNRIHTVFDKY